MKRALAQTAAVPNMAVTSEHHKCVHTAEHHQIIYGSSSFFGIWQLWHARYHQAASCSSCRFLSSHPIIIIITLSLSKAEKSCKEVELISEYRRRNTGWMTFQNPNRTCLVSKTISRISGCTLFDLVDIDNMQKGKRETDVSTSVRLRWSEEALAREMVVTCLESSPWRAGYS